MTGEKESTKSLQAVVQWAQRQNCLYLTVCLEDCKSPQIQLEQDKLIFKGEGGTEKKMHECTVEFYKPIDPENSHHVVRERGIDFSIKKTEESSSFWPRLLKEQTKSHWVKVDFNKWKDEDDSEDDGVGDVGGGANFEEMMRNMGDLGGGSKGLEDLEDEPDSDDEELPDLETV